MSARLFIVRHGNTFVPGEEPRRVGARTDLPLVDSGVAQAKALGRWVADRRLTFNRVLSSPLRRTRETAELILSHLPDPPPIEDAEWLREIDHGPDENRSEPDVVARIGQAALDAWDQDATPPPGWRVDASTRIAAWRSFLAGPLSGDILIVTSNGAARFALLAWPALAGGLAGDLKLRTGAVGEVAVGPDGPSLTAWNLRPPT